LLSIAHRGSTTPRGTPQCVLMPAPPPPPAPIPLSPP
jgi:hypothetical protein